MNVVLKKSALLTDGNVNVSFVSRATARYMSMHSKTLQHCFPCTNIGFLDEVIARVAVKIVLYESGVSAIIYVSRAPHPRLNISRVSYLRDRAYIFFPSTILEYRKMAAPRGMLHVVTFPCAQRRVYIKSYNGGKTFYV